MRLCKNCRWARCLNPAMQPQHQYWQCDHPTAAVPAKVDPVTGTIEPATQAACALVRGWEGLRGQDWCGPDGRLWEPWEEIDDPPELTDAELAEMRPAREVFPDDPFDVPDPPPEPVTEFDDYVCTREERRENLAASIIEGRPIGEDDEGAWEWCALWPEMTGLPWMVWVCDIAPVVLLDPGTAQPGKSFPARGDINRLYKWMQLNDELLENLGLHSSSEMLERLKRLP